MKKYKFNFELVQGNLYSITATEGNDYMLFIDGHPRILNEISYNSIKYSHQENILNLSTGRMHSGALFRFSISQNLFNNYTDYLRVLKFSKEDLSFADLRRTFKTIEDSFKEKKIDNKKLIGLHGELLTLNAFLDIGIDLTVSFQSDFGETKHDIITDRAIIEIKTTRNEHRNHTFSNIDQIDSTLISINGFVASVIVKKDDNGKNVSERIQEILSKVNPEIRHEFISKVRFLYWKYLSSQRKYSLKNDILFTAFDNIPKPVIDDKILSVEWQICWDKIPSLKLLSLKDLSQFFRS